ncbi:MAG: polysaccharide biosynthesis protein [Actinobacteria bacterium]|nr:polysaccharide biosynthesis protein [Actinomycetota bacterium]
MSVPMLRIARQSMDVLVLVTAYVVAFWMRYNRQLPDDVARQIVVTLPYVVALKYVAMGLLRVPRHSWRYAGLTEGILVARAMLAASFVLVAVRMVAPSLMEVVPAARYAAIPYVAIMADFLLATFGLIGVRILRRVQSERQETGARFASDRPATRVLLVGAGRAGVLVARELQGRRDLNMIAVGFVDDDVHKRGQLINGIPVLGTTADIADIVRTHRPKQAIITMANADGRVVRRVLDLCKDVGLDTRIIPGIFELVGGNVNLSRIRPVRIEDLLRRDPVELETSAIRDLVAHEVVLVTGAGGSIGSELCRQLAAFGPRELVLVEQAEMNLWAIHRELEATFPDVTVIPRIADVCDAERVDQILLQHRPSTIFHAAAHKHVPMMEWNPGEAIKNNVIGTRTVADLALRRGVGRFVLISTDKAVNPTSIMGATKRVAERYVQHLAHVSGKPFVSVRFGNVLGSTGSVIPVFEQQIREGGPVTITHPDMQRYFMTIPEASQLVLQAATLGTSGEIFVLDMGEPSSIVDLATDLIRLSGLEPGVDIEIEFTGARPGEKLFEELSLDEENADRTRHPKIWVGHAPSPDWQDAEADLAALGQLIDSTDTNEVRSALKYVVPEFIVEDITGELPVIVPQDLATFVADRDDLA